MTITRFIEKAVAGEWIAEEMCTFHDRKILDGVRGFVRDGFVHVETEHSGWKSTSKVALESIDVNRMLLDPKFWQALGKTEGWAKEDGWTGYVQCPCGDVLQTQQATFAHEQLGHIKRPLMWRTKWHLMLDALAEGKTPEEFLATL